MLRHLGLIAVCACVVASVGCGGGKLTAPGPPPPPPPVPNSITTVTVEFGGRVVNADAGGPVGNVRVSLDAAGDNSAAYADGRPPGWVFPTDTATSGGDGTFALSLNLPNLWTFAGLKFTGPAGYDDLEGRFEPTAPCHYAPCWAAADRPAIRMYPTLVIRPGESIDVRVESTINLCAPDRFFGPFACRRVLVEASPGEPVELEIVPPDTSKPMGLTADERDEQPVVRRMVAPGSFAYVVWEGADTTRQGRLTARR
jgi:hypothetical protein